MPYDPTPIEELIGDSMTYLTQLDDSQLSFGSGSSINADDIPNGVTNFFLTNTTQTISGVKTFDSKIIDNTSGSIFRTLTVTEDLTVGGHSNLQGGTNILNGLTSDNITSDYFYVNSFISIATGSDCEIIFGGDSSPANIFQASVVQPLYINTNSADLYLGTSKASKAFTVHNNRSIFGPNMTTFSGSTVCTGNVNVNGKVIATKTSGSIFRTLSTLGNTHIGGTLTSIGNINCFGNMYVDYDNSAGLVGGLIYFGGTSANLKYIGSPVNGFLLSKGISIAGATTISSSNLSVTAGTVTASANSGSIFKTLTAYGNVQSMGTLIGNGLKLNITPDTGTITPNKTITISLNNVNYKIAVKAA